MSASRRTVLWSNQALAPSTTLTAGPYVLSHGYGAQLGLAVVNGSSPPTVAAQIQVQVSNDPAGSLWVNDGPPFVAGTDANTTYSTPVVLSGAAAAVRVVAVLGAATNGVTLDADLNEITSQAPI